MESEGTDVLIVTDVEAAQLKFPIGHPRYRVTYVGHPVKPAEYLPFSDFHRALFEHKVAEALRLVRALGATIVAVEHIQGWDEGLGIHLGVALPTALEAEVSTSAGMKRGQGAYIMSRMTLLPTGPPTVPSDLVWLPQEPLWQEIVRARMESGLSSFALDVRSTDDYGINGSLKTLVSKAGLELGGSFTEHQNTIWRLSGAFVTG